MAPLGRNHTVIAMDTPGYGQSDRLSNSEPSIEDYANGVIEFMDALGLGRIALYGMLTGTMIGVDLATRYPDRFSVVLLNTMLVHTDEELDSFVDRFTPDIPLRADGLHLVQTWDLMRRNAVAYPWFEPGPKTRFDLPLPSPEELHLRLMNCLSAGLEYGWGARAAFRFLRRARITDIKAPTVFLSDRSPPFGVHGERLEPLPHNGRMYWFDDWGGLAKDIAQLLSESADAEDAPPPPSTAPMADRFHSECIALGNDIIHARISPQGSGRPVLLVHGAGSEATVMERYSTSLIGGRPVVAFDLPGHGASTAWIDRRDSKCGGLAKLLDALLDHLGFTDVDLFVSEAGAAIAVQFAVNNSRRVSSIAWHDVLWPPEDRRAEFMACYSPSIEPDYHGGYLLQAWGFLRDQDLYAPWFDKSRTATVWESLQFDVDDRHTRAVALLKGLSAQSKMYGIAFDEHYSQPLDEIPIRICTAAGDPKARFAEGAAESMGISPLRLSKSPSTWVEQALA